MAKSVLKGVKVALVEQGTIDYEDLFAAVQLSRSLLRNAEKIPDWQRAQ